MYFKKLFIRDFGIYNNAELEDLDPGIVVIGGKNRGGKSTFLKLLRSFAYGFEKSSDMPFSKVEYEAEGELCEAENNILNVRVKGFGKPEITAVNNKQDDYKGNLYGEVDSFTYKQLFTISLDELQNLEKEEEKLQAVLLGAGLKDIIRLPKMVAAFRKEAEKIGGKSGNSKIKLFKAISSSISEAVETRENINKQVTVYENNIKELEHIDNSIKQYRLENAGMENKIIILEALINNYDIYVELNEIQLQLEDENTKNIYEQYKGSKLSLEYLKELKEEYKNLSEKHESAKLDFQKNIGGINTSLNIFKSNSDNIKNAQLVTAGIREKIKNYNFALESIKKAKQSLTTEFMDINGQDPEDFTQVLNINTEEIYFSQLCEDIDNFNTIKQQEDENKSTIGKLQGEKRLLEEEIKTTPLEEAKSLRLYFIAALWFTAAGFILYILNKTFGTVLSVFGIGGLVLYTFIKINQVRENNVYILNKKNGLKSLKTELSVLEDRYKVLNNDKEKLNSRLNSYKEKLQLNANVSVNSMKDYFRIVRDVKKRVLELKYNLDNLSNLEADINKEMYEIYNLSYSFKDIVPFDELKVRRNFIVSSEYMFKFIEDLKDKSGYYENYIEIDNLKENLEQKICTMLNCEQEELLYKLEKTIEEIIISRNFSERLNKYLNLKNQLLHGLNNERVQKAFSFSINSINDSENSEHNIKEQLLKTFKNNLEKYSNSAEIEEEKNSIKIKLGKNTEILEKLKEKKTNIKMENENIYNSDSLNCAQQKIESGRRELKLLAEKYAAYGAAAFVLEKVQQNFIEKTKYSLLLGAESILNEITGGEYVSILPPEDLTKCDFITAEKNGAIKESAEILSRGTKEQLFLSVRLSRIKEIKSKLPVIIDDSLVNFDSNHLKNVITVLKKLSVENQIFILTCHPEVVSFITETDKKASKNIQYFKLEQGKFYKTKGEQLINYLSAK